MIESRVLEVAPHSGDYTNYHKARRRSLFFFLYVDHALFVYLSFFSSPPPPSSIRWILYSTMVYSFGLPVCSFHLCPSANCLSVSFFPTSFSHNRFSFSLSLTFSLVRKLQHPLFYSLSSCVSLSVRLPQPRSLFSFLFLSFTWSLYLSSMPFVSMQPPSVRDGSAGHGESEARARPCLLDFGGVSLSDTTHSYRCTLQY